MNLFGFNVEIIEAADGFIVKASSDAGFMNFDTGAIECSAVGYFIEYSDLDAVAPVLIGILQNF